MLKQIVRWRVGLMLLLGIPLFCSSVFAMAQDYGRDNRRDNKENDRRDNRGNDRKDSRGERHYYRDGRWYKHDSLGHEIAVTALAIGALMESLPPQHTTVIVQNTPYYYDNTRYYQQLPDGTLVVVPPPRR
jgi:hypothetical protein